MRIRIVEDIEDDLIVQKEQYEEILSSLDYLFSGEDFDKKEEVNGTSFNKESESIVASFYIDTNGAYKGYITNNSNNSSTYSMKGEIENALKAAENFIDIFNKEIMGAEEENAED